MKKYVVTFFKLCLLWLLRITITLFEFSIDTVFKICFSILTYLFWKIIKRPFCKIKLKVDSYVLIKRSSYFTLNLTYKFINKNIKEEVNFINFTWEFHCTLSVQMPSDGTFNIEILYMSNVVELYESGAVWKLAGGGTTSINTHMPSCQSRLECCIWYNEHQTSLINITNTCSTRGLNKFDFN